MGAGFSFPGWSREPSCPSISSTSRSRSSTASISDLRFPFGILCLRLTSPPPRLLRSRPSPSHDIPSGEGEGRGWGVRKTKTPPSKSGTKGFSVVPPWFDSQPALSHSWSLYRARPPPLIVRTTGGSPLHSTAVLPGEFGLTVASKPVPGLHLFTRLAGGWPTTPDRRFCYGEGGQPSAPTCIVDPEGFEPSTFSMPLRRAPNCAMGPKDTAGRVRTSMDLEGFEPSTSSVRLKRAPNCATGPHLR